MPCRVIFFDIDGTLLNTGGAGQQAMELALQRDFRIDVPFEGVLTAGRTDRGITQEVFERYSVDDTPENRTRFQRAYLSYLPATLESSPGLLLPGVRELLDALLRKEVAMLSLLTGNYADGAWIKLRHYQLDHFFESGGFGDHHADRDDVARHALDTVRRESGQQVAGPETMVIGDTPADIRCARAIGATAVAVATGHYSSEELSQHSPDHLFDDFSNPESAIDRILELL